MYWALGLRESKLISIGSEFLSENLNFQEDMNAKLKTTKIYLLRFWMWEITGKLFEEIFLLRYIERGSIVYSDHYNNSPQSSHHAEAPH